jgi:hypothetical protein
VDPRARTYRTEPTLILVIYVTAHDGSTCTARASLSPQHLTPAKLLVLLREYLCFECFHQLPHPVCRFVTRADMRRKSKRKKEEKMSCEVVFEACKRKERSARFVYPRYELFYELRRGKRLQPPARRLSLCTNRQERRRPGLTGGRHDWCFALYGEWSGAAGGCVRVRHGLRARLGMAPVVASRPRPVSGVA